MIKPNSVLALGLWLIALSFFGIPTDWFKSAVVITGTVLVLVFVANLGRESIHKILKYQPKADTFSESDISASKTVTEPEARLVDALPKQ